MAEIAGSTKRSVGQRLALGVVRGYQLTLSRVLRSNCRYYPSCSRYTYEAIEIHGALRGSWMGVKRIGRCHPWHEGGFDPVPGSPSDDLRTATESEGA